MTEAFINVINSVPEEYRYLLKHRLLVIPSNIFFPEFTKFKDTYIHFIKNSKNSEINLMHKFSTCNPIEIKKCSEINVLLYPFVREFYELFYNKYPHYYAGFGIYYSQNVQKNLDLHKDDSLYTINMCLENTSENNEIVFNINNKEIPVYLKEDMMLIHLGSQAHYTKSIENGNRTNIIMWFK